MPKKISLDEKRKWLQSYEKGKPELQIAKEAHKNIKTVKRGIEEARSERYAATAQAEMVKGALQRHQDNLLGIINRVLSALALPTHDLPLSRDPNGSLSPMNLSGATLYYNHNLGLVLTLPDEGTTLWGLLCEHLKGDRIWKNLEQWKKAMVAHVQARSALNHATSFLLKHETGYDYEDKSISPPRLYSYTTVNLLYQAAVDSCLGITGEEKLENMIIADTETGRVRKGVGTILAEAPGAEVQCRANIIQAFEKLLLSAEIGQVSKTYEELEVIMPKTRRLVEEMSLLGMVPGRCRVCRRLSIQ